MSMKNAIDEIFTQRENFIIIGLTGRSGSGCSTAADILSKRVDELAIVEPSLKKMPLMLTGRITFLTDLQRNTGNHSS